MLKHDYNPGVLLPAQDTTDNVVQLADHNPETDIPEPLPEPPVRAARRRVLKSGSIKINENFAEFPCTIRNLSETGVLLEVSGEFLVPSQFNLTIPMDGFKVDCEVARRDGRTIGARFTSIKQQLTTETTQFIRSSTDPAFEKYIKNDDNEPKPLTDTQAIRRTNAPPVANKPGFGKRSV